MKKIEIIPAFASTYSVGAILVDTWGYEQTNIDFYCIIKSSGDWITVLPMTKKCSKEGSFMCHKNEPGDIIYTATPIRKKLKKSNGEAIGFSFRDYTGGGWCKLWNNKPAISTQYA